jgi:hypothetical protein
MRYIKPCIPLRVVKGILLFLCVLLCFNTVGNMFSIDLLEKVIFTPVTAILALLIYRLVTE